MRTARRRLSRSVDEPDYLPTLRDRIRQYEADGAGVDLRGDRVAATALSATLCSGVCDIDLPDLAVALARLVGVKSQALRAQLAAEMHGAVSLDSLRAYTDALLKLCERFVPSELRPGFEEELRQMARPFRG